MPLRESILLPEDDFVSMQEATRKFDVSIEELRSLAEKGLLPVYVQNYKLSPPRYAKIKSPHWILDTLDGMNCPAEYLDIPGKPIDQDNDIIDIQDGKNCPAEVQDMPGKPIDPFNGFLDTLDDEPDNSFFYAVGFTYEQIMIRPQELRALRQEQSNQDNETELNQASQILTARRTAERDKYVEEIMSKILSVVKENRNDHTMMINHIRFIREAEVPKNMFDSVKLQVASRIKTDYGSLRYKALSRAPKKKVIEPYLLPS
jgi:hypothetical protein